MSEGMIAPRSHGLFETQDVMRVGNQLPHSNRGDRNHAQHCADQQETAKNPLSLLKRPLLNQQQQEKWQHQVKLEQPAGEPGPAANQAVLLQRHKRQSVKKHQRDGVLSLK